MKYSICAARIAGDLLRGMLTALLCSATQSAAWSQAKADMGHGNAMLMEASRLMDKERPQEALRVLSTVHRSDTVYERTLQQRLQILVDLDDYEAAEKLCREGIALAGPGSGGFMVMHSAVLLDMKRYDEAIAAADSAIRNVPGLFRPRHLKVVGLSAKGDKQAALALAMDNARRFPYRRDAHVILGTMAYSEGHTAQAALAIAMAQIVRFDDEMAGNLLAYYDGILAGNVEPKREGFDLSITGDDFGEEDILLRSMAAMSKKYKVKPDLTYPMCRQSHLLFSTIAEDPSPGVGFYREYYGPMVKTIMERNLFEGFIYHCLANSSNKSINAVAVKNKAKVEAFRKQMGDLLRERYSMIPPMEGGPAVLHLYHDDGDLFGHGPGDPTTRAGTGEWTYFHSNGRPSAKGTFNAEGKREGTWYNWAETGMIKSTAVYSNGVTDGPLLVYHPNGNLRDSSIVIKDLYQGEVCSHYSLGGRKACKFAVDDVWNGPAQEYFVTGAMEWTYQLAAGKTEGTIRQFHPDGSLHYTGDFVNDLRTGTHVNHHLNGRRSSEYAFMNGKAEGPFKEWHDNGQLASEGTMKNDRTIGERRTHDPWGTLTLISRFDDQGRQQGLREEFNDDGTRYMDMEYNKDLLMRYAYYDRSGKVLSQGSRSKGRFDLKGHHPDGGLRVEGTYLDEGAKDGVWKYYYPDGTLDTEERFERGTLTGVQRYYAEDGTLSGENEVYIRNGATYRTFLRYFPSGTVRQEGQYKGERFEGTMRRYFPDGTLQSVEYYRNGEREGWQDHYDADGKAWYSERFLDGAIAGRVSHDENGEAYEHIEVPTGPFTMVLHHQQGAVSARLDMMNGNLHGKANWYYPDGRIEVEGNYLDGRRHGKWTGYRHDGKKSYEQEYHLGQLNGVELLYYPDGQLRRETPYQNADQHGTAREYHLNGKIAFLREYANDEYHGRVISYTHDGTPQMVRFYHKGRLTGYGSPAADGSVKDTIPLGSGVVHLESRFPNGQVSRRMTYRNGELDGEFIEYHTNGQVMEQAIYRVGSVVGTSTEYFSNGKVHETIPYLEGRMHGERVIYWENGQVRERMTYVNGMLHGPRSFHDRNGKVLRAYRMRNDNVVEIP